MSQPLIDLQHISKSFDGELILDDLNLSIRENSFVTLLGPSGCGKTLLCVSWEALPVPIPEGFSLMVRISQSFRPTSGS